MITWKNLDTLAAYGKLAALKGRVNLPEAMAGEGGKVSPRALDMYAEGDTLVVRLTQSVKTKDGEAPRLLEIAGKGGAFVPAETVADGCTLRLKAEGIARPVKARYAWTDYSEAVNLFGENGLPLEPFEV